MADRILHADEADLSSGLVHAVLEGSRAAFAAIRANALRSALTALGIIIGVAAVIAVVAIMQGLSRNIVAQLDDLGSDTVTLRAWTSTEQTLLGTGNRIDYNDFLALQGRVPGVLDMTAQMQAYSFGSGVSHGRNTTQTQVIGTDSSYQNVVRVYPERGRFLTASDDERRRRVAVLGASVVDKLEIPGDPIGQFVRIGSEWFRVIGVAERRGSLFGMDQDNYVIAPFSTMRSLNGERVERNIEIMFRPAGTERLPAIQQQMGQILRARHRVAEGEPDPFEFVTAERIREQFDAIIRGVTLVAGGVVGISLIVGGIGIMNIMLVSVTERTREIGIVKALGATPRFILVQFLIEAVVLSLFGGLVGLLLGWGLAALLALFIPGMSGAAVPVWAMMLALGFTSLIGIVFGLAPAVKASRLHPIDALRYE
ncbi:ABC transporter permease [Luteimonas sp. BDR2-5]|uniref:ABC transporter permease n=1 Tax=Proluteimonas luteida TaxID=2878685 RepID=UPI001E658A1D|nr:ABC transporter permease [Luteimonas sp. BDR2-5]MCD9027635.1 ABC transporter permease [Luteimonas sp. BDR2-5]